MRIIVLALAGVLVLSGCSAKSGAEGGAEARSDEINDSQIAQTQAVNAWDAVAALRPEWLQSTDRTGAFRPVVYVDGERVGNVEQLRSVQAGRVMRIRFMSPYEGQRRYGRDHSGGVFWVTLIR
ncbi:MAG: hypothetical protein JSU87_00485 [Gemmatimonadota bacterium]|nr:MAG: hypothetical protein JSU87_00485 [Gemmatimonadota bacterium]